MALLSEVALNISTAATTTVIAGVTGQTIKVYQMFYYVGGADNVTVQDSGGTAIFPIMNWAANQGLVLVNSTYPWITVTAGLGLQVITSAAQQLSGRVYYSQATV